MEQKKAFISYEADAWFERNKNYIQNYKPQADSVIQLLKKYQVNCNNVLEIGASAGYRLQGIKEELNAKKVTGVEPSAMAIAYGNRHYPSVNLINTTADSLGMIPEGSVELVIMGFVFYVIDRSLVLKAISEIDRVLSNGGHLVLVDFFSETTLKNKYHHIDDFNAYSFKQNYDEIFSATKL
ncbi:class I SAM-dependent methyltransferase [Reichenbachiella sp.]